MSEALGILVQPTPAEALSTATRIDLADAFFPRKEGQFGYHPEDEADESDNVNGGLVARRRAQRTSRIRK